MSTGLLVATFARLAEARAALAELRRLADEDAVGIRTAAVIVREADGRFWMPEGEQHVGVKGTAAGGILGAVLGALTGPVGLVVGGAAGALAGSRADAHKAATSEAAVAEVARLIRLGTAALVADGDARGSALIESAFATPGGRCRTGWESCWCSPWPCRACSCRRC